MAEFPVPAKSLPSPSGQDTIAHSSVTVLCQQSINEFSSWLSAPTSMADQLDPATQVRFTIERENHAHFALEGTCPVHRTGAKSGQFATDTSLG